MRKKHVLRMLSCVLVLMWMSATHCAASERKASEPIDIVREGKAETVIIIPDDPSSLEKYSAEELQYHVKKATGAKLPIVKESKEPSGTGLIYIGKCKAADKEGFDKEKLAINGYMIKLIDGNLFLYGNDKGLSGKEFRKNVNPLSKGVSVGTMSSVYKFLEDKMGVRWLWPGKTGEYIPKTNNISVEKWDKIYSPRLTSKWLGTGPLVYGRPLWQSDQAYEKYSHDTMVWVRRHRFNKVAPSGISHSFNEYWERYGKTHPEYFAQQPNGKRQPLDGNPSGNMICMCVSNKGLVKQIVKDWQEKKFRPWIWSNNEYIECGDGDSPAVCTCEKCRAWDAPDPGFKTHPYWTGEIHPTIHNRGFIANETSDSKQSPSVSDRYARFYLEVQKEAQKINPDVKVIGLAYVNYSLPPKQTKLNDHIYITIVGAGAFPFSDYAVENFKEQWEGWAKTGANLFFRPNMTYGAHNMPSLYSGILYDVFTFAAKNNLKGTNFDALLGEYATQGPTLYLLARIHTCPDMPLDKILDEYYSAFGPAKDAVRTYFDYWENVGNHIDNKEFRRVCKEEKAGVFQSWLRVADHFFTPEVMAKGHKLMEDIKKVKGLDNAEKARVNFIDKGLEHAELTLDALIAYKKYKKSGNDIDKFAAGAAMKKLFDFRKKNEALGISNMGYLALRERATWQASLASINKSSRKITGKWKFKFDTKEDGQKKGWQKADFDDSKWDDIGVDSCWEKQAPGKEWKKKHGKDFDGIAWYRKHFKLKPEDAGRKVELLFGAVDEGCVIYVNGKKVLTRKFNPSVNPGAWNEVFSVDISKAVNYKGDNVLAVAVEDRVGAGGVWKPVYMNLKGPSDKVRAELENVKKKALKI